MSKKQQAKQGTPPTGRLRPGELDGLVLDYMRRHKKDWPLTATAIGKGIGRSSGAVANCLARRGATPPAVHRPRSPCGSATRD